MVNQYIWIGIAAGVFFVLFPLIPSIGIIPHISFVDAYQPKDIETQCREGQVLVFRITSNNYVCVSESTADRWEDLGIAEKIVNEPEDVGGLKDFMKDNSIIKIIEKIERGERISANELLTIKKAIQSDASDELQKETYPRGTAEAKGTLSLGGYAFGSVASGTITSAKADGFGEHEAHQVAIILPISEKIYVGKITFSASEPVQYVTAHGPLAEDEFRGQPVYDPIGETKFALTMVDNGQKSGGWFFTGHGLALHTYSDTPFTASYSVVYSELDPGEYPKGTVATGTIHSIQDPGLGHEDHSLAMILPPRDTPYRGGVLAFSASEPVQLVALHGPLAEGEDKGQAIWSPDGETKYAWTLIDSGSKMGVWTTFTGNALALHTMNPDGFTVTYTVDALH